MILVFSSFSHQNVRNIGNVCILISAWEITIRDCAVTRHICTTLTPAAIDVSFLGKINCYYLLAWGFRDQIALRVRPKPGLREAIWVHKRAAPEITDAILPQQASITDSARISERGDARFPYNDDKPLPVSQIMDTVCFFYYRL